MPEPLTSSAAPPSSWFARFSGTGWGGRAFWSILICVTLFLLICGYGAFVGANKQNLHFAFLGGMSGFAATAMGAVLAIALRDIAARTQDTMLGFAAGMMLAASSLLLWVSSSLLSVLRKIFGTRLKRGWSVFMHGKFCNAC